MECVNGKISLCAERRLCWICVYVCVLCVCSITIHSHWNKPLFFSYITHSFVMMQWMFTSTKSRFGFWSFKLQHNRESSSVNCMQSCQLKNSTYWKRVTLMSYPHFV